jgi:hypothetical protein
MPTGGRVITNNNRQEKKMCGLCKKSQAFLMLEDMQGICVPCMVKVKQFNITAPNPFQTGESK